KPLALEIQDLPPNYLALFLAKVIAAKDHPVDNFSVSI
ncbi:MAG: hypothetical protein RLZZ481_972, partial [Pseudomonadota bacterium]